MARAGRLAGAILAETRGELYLVGNPKMPCDWGAAGFEPPSEIEARERSFVRLSPRRVVEVPTPHLTLEVEGEALPRLLAEVFLIQRTGSVSERLWRLVTGASDEGGAATAGAVAARWLGEIPPPVWRIVRETVLRCT